MALMTHEEATTRERKYMQMKLNNEKRKPLCLREVTAYSKNISTRNSFGLIKNKIRRARR